jgi:hypothetical protein
VRISTQTTEDDFNAGRLKLHLFGYISEFGLVDRPRDSDRSRICHHISGWRPLLACISRRAMSMLHSDEWDIEMADDNEETLTPDGEQSPDHSPSEGAAIQDIDILSGGHDRLGRSYLP